VQEINISDSAFIKDDTYGGVLTIFFVIDVTEISKDCLDNVLNELCRAGRKKGNFKQAECQINNHWLMKYVFAQTKYWENSTAILSFEGR
jgi:hypothetical protein